MCSYDTTFLTLVGSAKRESGWTAVGSANIYQACPAHAPLEDALNIDFIVRDRPRERIALELSPDAARSLAHAILATLDHPTLDHP